MLTDEQIKAAIDDLFDGYQPEHYDCVRIAYEWLDAQKKIKTKSNSWQLCTKHLIERWGGRYVAENDVCIAASIHDGIFGDYPAFNIASKLTFPSKDRLHGIESAGTQPNYDATCDIDSGFYKHFEANQ